MYFVFRLLEIVEVNKKCLRCTKEIKTAYKVLILTNEYYLCKVCYENFMNNCGEGGINGR